MAEYIIFASVGKLQDINFILFGKTQWLPKVPENPINFLTLAKSKADEYIIYLYYFKSFSKIQFIRKNAIVFLFF